MLCTACFSRRDSKCRSIIHNIHPIDTTQRGQTIITLANIDIIIWPEAFRKNPQQGEWIS